MCILYTRTHIYIYIYVKYAFFEHFTWDFDLQLWLVEITSSCDWLQAVCWEKQVDFPVIHSLASPTFSKVYVAASLGLSGGEGCNSTTSGCLGQRENDVRNCPELPVRKMLRVFELYSTYGVCLWYFSCYFLPPCLNPEKLVDRGEARTLHTTRACSNELTALFTSGSHWCFLPHCKDPKTRRCAVFWQVYDMMQGAYM